MVYTKTEGENQNFTETVFMYQTKNTCIITFLIEVNNYGGAFRHKLCITG